MVASVSCWYYGYCLTKIMKTDNNGNKEYCSITILDGITQYAHRSDDFSQQKPAWAPYRAIGYTYTILTSTTFICVFFAFLYILCIYCVIY